MRIILVSALLFAAPVFACPQGPDFSERRGALLSDLSTAQDFMSARAVQDEIWKLWFTAPDKQSQNWLDEGVARMRQADLATAEAILRDLVAYCPDYAEGYNQLAFAQFLQEDLGASEDNLKRTIEIEPNHFAALAGLGLIAQKRGNIAVAKLWIRRAVALHPFLKERRILDLPDKSDKL